MATARRHEQRDPRHYERSAFLYPAVALDGAGKKLIVEVGPGRGDFLFHMAELHPAALVVGIEIKGKRVDKLIARTERRGLRNVRLIQDDARAALPRHFNQCAVDEIHVQFPDPWPKHRHAKNRSMNEGFLTSCLRALKPGGTLTFITDHRPYAEEVAKRIMQFPQFESCYAESMMRDAPDAFPTFFAQKWISEGREITYQKYQHIG
jgi:tRNA (guanine-N7-)-methyltransferase